MYKYYKFLLIFFLVLNSNAFSSENKIVYLNLDNIVQQSIPGKIILKELESLRKENINKFKSKESELKSKENDIIKKKNILSKEEFETKLISLNKEMKVYNDERKKIYLQFEEIKKKRLNDFLEKITPIIEIFVKENSINLVLNEKNLFIASKKFDITNDIIQIVNKKIK
tara:strand:- start:1634 stop:2143 length:510 start_codon:yes stop_codon:yes gene_type:complete